LKPKSIHSKPNSSYFIKTLFNMADSAASTEPKLVKEETETKPLHGDAATEETHKETPATESLTTTATNAATTAASTVTAAASGVADNVFSMFGGGAKKEKKRRGGGSW